MPDLPTVAPLTSLRPAPTDAVAAELAALFDPLRDELVAIRRDIHAHPELGRTEVRTTGLVADRLRVAGLDPHLLPASGLVCDIGPGPTLTGRQRIALRADLDALPVADATGLPWASTHPFGMLLAPEVAVPDLPSLDDAGRDGFAAVLVDVLERLDRLFDAPMPYMLWIHQRPFDGQDWPSSWLHVHLAPLYRSAGTPRYLAAAEQGCRVFYNPVAPEAAAALLRGAAAPEPEPT